MSMEFDFIIVGAGSAGCVLAASLSSLSKRTVLLLEAGPKDKSLWIRIPAGIPRIMSAQKYTWQYKSEPEKFLKDRQLHWPRGRTLGGTGSINGLAHLRGQREDYDNWAAMGCSGWDWKSVLPIFKDIENYWGRASILHGYGSGIQLNSMQRRSVKGDSLDRATRLFIDNAVQMGIPLNNDFNSGNQEGVGWIDHNVDNRGRRHSSSNAFLKPAMKKDNLEVWTNAFVERILLSEGRADGVEIMHQDQRKVVKCREEVILCGGTINSPQTLMLSGIGPSQDLSQHGIKPIVHSPEVGKNLHDHTYLTWVHEVTKGLSINSEIRGIPLFKHIARFYFQGKGLLTTGASTAYLFTKVMPQSVKPDMQIAFRPLSDEVFVSGVPGHHSFPGWSASICYLQPNSRGEVRLKSADPKKHPAIIGNYLKDPEDVEAMKRGLNIMDDLYSAPMIKEVIKRRLIPHESLDLDDDLATEDFVRSHTGNMHHPVGTCAMGKHSTSVVDNRLRVRGVDGLRIADASIMPKIVSANTNAAALMIGAKAALLIKEDMQGR